MSARPALEVAYRPSRPGNRLVPAGGRVLSHVEPHPRRFHVRYTKCILRGTGRTQSSSCGSQSQACPFSSETEPTHSVAVAPRVPHRVAPDQRPARAGLLQNAWSFASDLGCAAQLLRRWRVERCPSQRVGRPQAPTAERCCATAALRSGPYSRAPLELTTRVAVCCPIHRNVWRRTIVHAKMEIGELRDRVLCRTTLSTTVLRTLLCKTSCKTSDREGGP